MNPGPGPLAVLLLFAGGLAVIGAAMVGLKMAVRSVLQTTSRDGRASADAQNGYHAYDATHAHDESANRGASSST